jgi:hypothetical protein
LVHEKQTALERAGAREKAARNVPSVVCCSRTHVHRFVNAVVCGCGHVQCEIAFVVRTLSRVESGAFLYGVVVSDSIEN